MHNGSSLALLRLLQLASPTLPVGAYAYSQGLEHTVEAGWVRSETQAQDWLLGLMRHNLGYLDVPVFLRLYAAWQRDDGAAVAYWNAFLFASRESHELQKEDRHLGAALLRLLTQLEVADAKCFESLRPLCFASAFAFAAVRWSVPQQEAAIGLVWSWLENQVAAAIKLVPLGQTAGQRILSHCLADIPRIVENAQCLQDDEIGRMSPSLALASATHEVQYSRLFQS